MAAHSCSFVGELDGVPQNSLQDQRVVELAMMIKVLAQRPHLPIATMEAQECSLDVPKRLLVCVNWRESVVPQPGFPGSPLEAPHVASCGEERDHAAHGGCGLFRGQGTDNLAIRMSEDQPLLPAGKFAANEQGAQ